MDLAGASSDIAAPSRDRDVLPAGSDRVLLGLVFAGLALLYLPTYWSLATSIWQSADQSQGPLMLAASMWLLYDRRGAIAALPAAPRNGAGIAVLGI
ncbi:MAG: archaeosortase/exosortase family protein, partial [Rhizobacter sp.]